MESRAGADASYARSCGDNDLRELGGRVHGIRDGLVRWEQRLEPVIGRLPPASRKSARNLVHYLALRSHDLRSLQERLASCGLSSLGRAESHVLASLDALLENLDRVAPPEGTTPAADHVPRVDRKEGRALLQSRADALFGPRPASRSVRIMVTVPDEAASDPGLVRDLIAGGMDCMRINCAHGDPDAWLRMIANLRAAERELGRSCAVLMDLSGPRARTGSLPPGPEVVKIKPDRDALGRVTRPASVWLTPDPRIHSPPAPADGVIPLPAAFLDRVHVGDELRFRDARESKRKLVVTGAAGAGRWARLGKTAYVVTGMPIRHATSGDAAGADASAKAGERAGESRSGGEERDDVGRVGSIPAVPQRIPLAAGDRLVLTRSQEPGAPATVAGDGTVQAPARIPCFPPAVLDDVRTGEPIWFDEGRVGGRIESVARDEVVVEVTATRPGGDRLGAEKGINLPETELRLPALTEQDVERLPLIAEHADLIGYSFVRTAGNVEELYRRLDVLGAGDLGVVLKIETARAFEELPAILLTALRRPTVGVMIARGDLAVECGFARLAEVQEEILWLCEAAHLPVIWATQVLEELSKRGRPSRAEVTDAAAGERAECVMLNKGPHLVDAVRALSSILARMQAHQAKKQSLLRHLHVAEMFLEEACGTDASATPGDVSPSPPGSPPGGSARR